MWPVTQRALENSENRDTGAAVEDPDAHVLAQTRPHGDSEFEDGFGRSLKQETGGGIGSAHVQSSRPDEWKEFGVETAAEIEVVGKADIDSERSVGIDRDTDIARD